MNGNNGSNYDTIKFTNNPRSQVIGVLSNFQFLDPECIVIYAGKDGGSMGPFARCCCTNFLSKTPSTSSVPTDNLEVTVSSRLRSSLAAGKLKMLKTLYFN